MGDMQADYNHIPKEGSPFILTHTGRQIFFDHVYPEDICIEDIAHALSHLCRYTGHTTMFYSVAQHSLLVTEKIPGNAETKLVALLHDAAEAYVGDVSSPLKKWIKEKDNWAYDSLHHAIQAVIHRRYGITNDHVHNDVRMYDQAAAIFEFEGFFGLSIEELERSGIQTTLQKLWEPWNPREFVGKNADGEFGLVEAEFIQRFETLMKAVGREELI